MSEHGVGAPGATAAAAAASLPSFLPSFRLRDSVREFNVPLPILCFWSCVAAGSAVQKVIFGTQVDPTLSLRLILLCDMCCC